MYSCGVYRFQTESSAIELAKMARSTAWMQACKRRAARAVDLAGVATNCIGCGQVTTVAISVTLV